MHSSSTPASTAGDLNVYGRTRDVLSYHRDDGREGRPLYLLLGGAAVAVVSLAFIAVLVYRTWVEQSLEADRSYYGISFLFVFYVAGIFLFCYGYELYDLPRALRLTIIAAVVSVVGLALIIVSLTALTKLKNMPSLAGDAAESSDGSLFNVIGAFAGTSASRRRRRSIFDSPGEINGSEPFLLSCRHCGEMFTPVPPAAKCPHCGKPALGG
jgi:hypothetical protein